MISRMASPWLKRSEANDGRERIFQKAIHRLAQPIESVGVQEIGKDHKPISAYAVAHIC